MKSSLNPIFVEAKENYNIVSQTYKILETTYDMKLSIHPAGQWILDNMYIIENEYSKIREDASVLKRKKLPVIKTHNGDKYIAIYYLAYELIENNTGYVDQNIILKCLKDYQKLSYLTSEELDLFILMLRLNLLKFIARVSLNILNSQNQKMNVEKILNKNIENFNILSEILFQDLNNFKNKIIDIGKIKNTNTAFVEYMAFRLKDLGVEGDKYFNILTAEADKIGFTVEEAIIKEHMEVAKTTSLVGRAILSYKQLNGINFREIFEKVNKIDESLMYDYTNEFIKCDYKTKARYREYIIKLAKKYSLSEVYIAKKAVDCSKKYSKHVGFFLVGDDKCLLKKELSKSYIFDKMYYSLIKPLGSYFYIISMLLIALLSAILVTTRLANFNNIIGNLLVAFISFGFILEIWEKTINYVIRKSTGPKILPRFDFAKSVDEKNITYVVMPSVISSIEKLDNLIKKMEITYLANRSNNMYYMLLGDCVSSDKEYIDIDGKIVEYAKERLDELNSKYPSNHNLFNFIYRKRVYSKGEDCYMGWERKRGALSHFNKLVLNRLNIKEIDKYMYLIYDDVVEAKYAITIDEDTMLSLNTAKDLVSIMAHPLNKPVLSKNQKIVEKGYGLIQPAVGLDIVAANKSIFSKIFGGFGGLDIYTTAVSNVYQDLFEEAIFCGKGIYDIELYEKLLDEEIPENLVLSHDLLEGSFLKAGLASDIEVQDGFPNNYIAYMKRNHRWYRGDMQIIKWLISPYSNLNFLSKWKIFDNIRRPMLEVCAFIALIISLFTSLTLFSDVVLITFMVINFGYIISIADIIVFGKSTHTREIQYIPLIHGIDSVFLTMCFRFLTIPYSVYITVDAFLKSIYRMLISKKHLLEWTTAEVLDKNAKGSLSYYIFNMIPNIIFGALILIYINSSFVTYDYNIHKYSFIFITVVAIFFILTPFLAYLLGKSHLFGRNERLDSKKEEEVLEVAKRTWTFFDSMMTQINNYLPTDNFQENRRYKIANRTSSTNIGFGAMAIINAYDLKFISENDAVIRLNNFFATIKKLDKWNGHLYNWYNIKTLEPLRPRFVSTVDSGNFIACLYVVKQFLIEIRDNTNKIPDDYNYRDYKTINELFDYIDELILDTDFSKLYDTTRNLFSIGYAQETGKLIDSYYDMLMSESRITSLIAIASRQVTSKHWFTLSRNLVNLDGYKGLVSWTGTAFEYYMPYLFNKSYEHTLIDQSLFFAKYSQKKYSKINNVPWGVSESAFAIKDGELNYQYQAFGIPWLGLKRGLNDYLVISPYSSLLMIEFAPQEVYKNIKALKSIGAYSSFGFYESIDYTRQHLPEDTKYEVVKTYMAHHQGMILTAINNYINKSIIKNRFHRNPDILACDILLKERERLKSNITQNIDKKENTFKQKDISIYTPFVHQDIVTPDTNTRNFHLSLLKGSEISSITTSNGGTYLMYNDKIVNRQRYTNINSSGNYVYLTDKQSGVTFPTTDCDPKYAKNKCMFVSTLNSTEYYKEVNDLEVNTSVFLSQEYSIEIRKISIYNNSDIRREVTINTYVEPALTDYMTNVVHPAFSNLQIETYYDKDLDVLVASKRQKNETDKELYVYTKLIGIDLEKDVETEKSKLENNLQNDVYDSNITRYPLWPILSYRASIILDPHERQEFYYILGVADNKYKISNTIINLDEESISKQYKLCIDLNNLTARYLKLESGKAHVYNEIIKEALFEKNNMDKSDFWNENLSQSMLWKYSISGDFPIILVNINKIESAGIIEEIINFMDYAKNRKITLDIVILIDEEMLQYGPIYTYVKTRIDRATYTEYTKGNIYVLNIRNLTNTEVKLLTFLSKKYITDINVFLPKGNEEVHENENQ
ncbi:MAG: hypothetical protein N2749_03480 [Clostridia bacterium]|nr:hypothetical protein [Clostridia bacterium]